MPNHFLHIKEVALRNNCPICYNNEGLHLSFEQRVVDNKFYRFLTSETKYKLNCKACKTHIYPVQWTDDIEQVFNYHKKAFEPKKSSFKLKAAFWVLITVILLILTILFVLVA